MSKLVRLKRLQKNEFKGWHIHHLDWNHNNNQDSNLILVHPEVHKVIHNTSVHEEWEVKLLNKIFLLSKKYSKDEIISFLKSDPKLERFSAEYFQNLQRIPHPKYDKGIFEQLVLEIK